MAALNGIFKPFFSLFASRSVRPSTGQSERRPVPSTSKNGEDEEQVFLASIAHLPAEKQQERVHKRLGYIRSAQRQGIMEAERSADQYHRTGEREYKFW
jgi:hypothetical protein